MPGARSPSAELLSEAEQLMMANRLSLGLEVWGRGLRALGLGLRIRDLGSRLGQSPVVAAPEYEVNRALKISTAIPFGTHYVVGLGFRP